MTFIDLPETITLPPSQARHNLAITSIVIYAIILPVTWLIEYPVIWKNWSSKRRRRNCFRVSFEVFFDFISLLCMSMYPFYHSVRRTSQGDTDTNRAI